MAFVKLYLGPPGLSPLSNEHGRVDESVGTVGQAGLLTA